MTVSDPTDDQSEAEAIDEDVVGAADYPPDRPLGVADALARDTTVPGEEVQDSLAERISREEPDLVPVGASDLDLRDELIQDGTDLEGAVAEGDDDLVLSESAGAARDDRPAEEQALHLDRDPDDETLTDILSENEQRYS